MLLNDELLLNYKRCQRRVYLNTYGDKQHRDAQNEFLLKLQRESQAHTAEVISTITSVYHQPQAPETDPIGRAEATAELMAQGVDYIYKGVLFGDAANGAIQDCLIELDGQIPTKLTLVGRPSLLVKQPGRSKFGDWTYTAVNVRYGSRPKSEYKLIAAFHAGLLAAQLETPVGDRTLLILKYHNRYWVDLDLWLGKTRQTLTECWQMLGQATEPEVFISRQHCNLCQWQTSCYTHAKAQTHLSLVPGVTPKRYSYLQQIGVNSLESLSTIATDHIAQEFGSEVAHQLQLQAHSIIHNQPILKSKRRLTIPPTATIEIYFDIEAEPDRNLDYLLGVVLVNRQTQTATYKAFLAETPDCEGKIWHQFLQFVLAYPDAPIFHYSGYEIDTIIRLAKLYSTPCQQTESILSRCVDLHLLVTRSTILPVESYSLKSLANWLGFQWRNGLASGEQSVCWYDQWLQTGDRALLDAIVCYNEDDCRATYQLKDWFTGFLQAQLD